MQDLNCAAQVSVMKKIPKSKKMHVRNQETNSEILI